MTIRPEDAPAYFAEFGAYERHFNDTQSRYRTLASTWLLGAVAAIGFVLTKQLNVDIDPSLLIAAIATAAAGGVGLLWNLDLLVYHRLLEAVFLAGLALEDDNPDVPKVRTYMLAGTGPKGVAPRVVSYYVGTTGALLLVAAVSIVVAAAGEFSLAGTILVGLGSATVAGGWLFWMHRRSSHKDTLAQRASRMASPTATDPGDTTAP